MRLTVVVKGHDSQVTERKMQQFGINSMREINHTQTETVFEAYPGDLEKIAHWFCDFQQITPGIGYPDGTCLIYSIHEDQDCRLIVRYKDWIARE